LIQNYQIIKAINCLKGWKTNNYFMMIAKIRAESKIKKTINDDNSKNIYDR